MRAPGEQISAGNAVAHTAEAAGDAIVGNTKAAK